MDKVAVTLSIFTQHVVIQCVEFLASNFVIMWYPVIVVAVARTAFHLGYSASFAAVIGGAGLVPRHFCQHKSHTAETSGAC